MFTIIGGDGKEYGPVSADQVRAWMTAGRANLDTQGKAAGTDEWRRLGDFAEFAPTEPESVPPPVGEAADVAAADETPLADPGLRLLSWLLDMVFGVIALAPGALMIGISFFVFALNNPFTPPPMKPTVQQELGSLLMLSMGLVLSTTQFVLLSTRGQTLGKIVFGIRIVRIEDETNPGFFRVILLRWLIPTLVIIIFPIFFVIDSCFIFRRDRRCLHDFIGGTKVVKV